jgi:hypothetical protein
MEFLLLAGIVYIVFIVYIEVTDKKQYAFPTYDAVLFIRLLPHIFGIVSLMFNMFLLNMI